MRHFLVVLVCLSVAAIRPTPGCPPFPDSRTSTLALVSPGVALADGRQVITFRATLRNICGEPVFGYPVSVTSAHGWFPAGQMLGPHDTFTPLVSDLTGPDGTALFTVRSTIVDPLDWIGLYCNGELANCWPSQLVVNFTPVPIWLPLILN